MEQPYVRREPLITRASIIAGVSAVLALVVAFGLDLSEEQIAAILGLATIAAPLAAAWWARGRVTPLD